MFPNGESIDGTRGSRVDECSAELSARWRRLIIDRARRFPSRSTSIPLTKMFRRSFIRVATRIDDRRGKSLLRLRLKPP